MVLVIRERGRVEWSGVDWEGEKHRGSSWLREREIRERWCGVMSEERERYGRSERQIRVEVNG